MKPLALVVAVTMAFATTMLGEQSNSQSNKSSADDSAKSEILRKLSRREREERIAKLDPRHQDFAADVEPIIHSSELDAFLMLETDAQRDAFIADFWQRRAKAEGTTDRVFKDAYYARLEVAKRQFRGTSSDRAKMFLLHGPPSSVFRAECERLLQPIEIWTYSYLRGIGQDVHLLFYKPRHSNEYRLWNPIGGSIALSDLAVDDSFIDAASPRNERGPADSESPYAYITRIQLECRAGPEIMRAISQMVQTRVELLKLFSPPEMNDEEVRNLLRSVVIADPGAPKLSAEFSVRYPAKEGSRTDVQMMLLIPRGEVSPAVVGNAEVYTIDVTGEVLKDGDLWERYRYRFDFPGNFEGDHFPIVIDRLLRPAEYTSRIKVIDASTGAEAIVEKDIDVPEIFTPTPVGDDDVVISAGNDESAEVPPAAPVPATIVGTVPADPEKPMLRIVPPPEDVVTGLRTIQTVVRGEAIKGVEFSLDGRKIAIRRAPPYAIDFDFGIIPEMRHIRAVALDEKGKPITGDDIVVNAGTYPFRVRIVSPRIAPHLVGPTRVEVQVHVPKGDRLAALELYWNETRVATMFDPPFVQTIDIPATEGVGYIRAVATLEDDSTPPAEDAVMINTPAYMEELNVHLVELPTTVLVNGKPTDTLTEKSFKVLDEGQPVAISKFEYVKNLPLSIGMAIDASGSMMLQMGQAQKAGAQFLESVMKRSDKAFLVSFNKTPQLVQRWSGKLADIEAGLAKLRGEGTTALYDAVVYSLYNFHGIRGQRALVLISDGKDTDSKFTFDQTLDYARRASVPIYAIGIGIRGAEMDVRYKLAKLASETGGGIYYIQQALDLQHVYDEIQTELRSQYIIGFYPSPDVKTGKWHEVTVQAAEGKVRTVSGYFP